MKALTSTFMVPRALLALIAIVATGVAAAGCGSATNLAVCQQGCDCKHCSAGELDQCRNELDSQELETLLIGCNDDFKSLIKCYGANMVCKDQEADVSACGREKETLSRCMLNCQISTCEPAPTEPPDPGFGTGVPPG